MRETIILPGMGADSSMYPQKHYHHLARVNFVDWPRYQGETTITALARRVIDQYGMTSSGMRGDHHPCRRTPAAHDAWRGCGPIY